MKPGQTNAGSFKPGNNANPNGRPPTEFSVKRHLKEVLSAPIEDEAEKTAYQIYEEKIARVKAMSLNMVKTAATVDPATGALPMEGVNMSKFLTEMFDGKAQQSTDLTSKGDKLQFPILGGISSEEQKDELSTGDVKD